MQIALDAVQAASQPHHFLSVTKDGRSAIVATTGNEDCHVILRGGKAAQLRRRQRRRGAARPAEAPALAAGRDDRRQPRQQQQEAGEPAPRSSDDIARQIAAGDRRIVGVMVESHLVAGRQDLVAGKPLVYGQSITDGCIGWETSARVLERLAQAVETRRAQTGRSERFRVGAA